MPSLGLEVNVFEAEVGAEVGFFEDWVALGGGLDGVGECDWVVFSVDADCGARGLELGSWGRGHASLGRTGGCWRRGRELGGLRLTWDAGGWTAYEGLLRRLLRCLLVRLLLGRLLTGCLLLWRIASLYGGRARVLRLLVLLLALLGSLLIRLLRSLCTCVLSRVLALRGRLTHWRLWIRCNHWHSRRRAWIWLNGWNRRLSRNMRRLRRRIVICSSSSDCSTDCSSRCSRRIWLLLGIVIIHWTRRCLPSMGRDICVSLRIGI